MYYIKIDEDKTNFYADIITLIYRTKEFLQKKKKKTFLCGTLRTNRSFLSVEMRIK